MRTVALALVLSGSAATIAGCSYHKHDHDGPRRVETYRVEEQHSHRDYGHRHDHDRHHHPRHHGRPDYHGQPPRGGYDRE